MPLHRRDGAARTPVPRPQGAQGRRRLAAALERDPQVPGQQHGAHALAGAVPDGGHGVHGGVEPLRGDLRPPVRVHVAPGLVAQADGERRDGDRDGGEQDAQPHDSQVIGRGAAIFKPIGG